MPAIKTASAPVFHALLEEANASIRRTSVPRSVPRAISALMELEVSEDLPAPSSYDDGPFVSEEVRSSSSFSAIDIEDDTLV